jgi:hypothetical protein
MMDSPFLLVATDDVFTAINLLQVVKFSLAKDLTLHMSNGEIFTFTGKREKLDILKLLSGRTTFLDGSPAAQSLQTVVDRFSQES